MDKIYPNKPVLLVLYGFPGSGKTYFSRQFCQGVHAAHLEEDKIRKELFENPKYTKQENLVVNRLMSYMAEEFLKAGLSVVYDANAMRTGQRRHLKELAKNNKAESVVLWLQVDADTAYIRNVKRDRRKSDDRYSAGYDVEGFKEVASMMQHPNENENYVVVSGKHTFSSQISTVMRKLADMLVVSPEHANTKIIKPELTNLVARHVPKSVNGKKSIVLR